MAIIGGLLAVIALLVVLALQAAHKRETGVAGPSRKTMAYLRRRARKLGISEDQAYQEWLVRKQRKTVIVTSPTSAPRYTLTPSGVLNGEAQFGFNCDDCGGYQIHVEDEPPRPSSPISCTACGQPLGILGDIEKAARDLTRDAGLRATGQTVWRDDAGRAV